MNVVLVDTSHLLYRSWHTFKQLTNKAGEPTGIHFGVMRSIEHLKRASPNTFIVFVLDGVPAQRIRLYPDYKGNRNNEPMSHGDIIHDFGVRMDITDLVKSSGCAVMRHPEYEADDVIGMLALAPEKYLPWNETSHVFIYSGDDDFCQLIRPNVTVWKPPASKTIPERFVLREDVIKEWGVEPEQLPLYRSFLGDVGDNIPRIPRINRLRLQQALRGKTLPDQFYDGDGLAYFQLDWHRKLTEFRPQLETNYQLTRLPWAFEDHLPIDFFDCGLDIGKLRSHLQKLEFSSILAKIGALEELLGPTSYAKAISRLSDRSQSGQAGAPGLEASTSGPGLASQSTADRTDTDLHYETPSS
jgi:DNA polymerase-1